MEIEEEGADGQPTPSRMLLLEDMALSGGKEIVMMEEDVRLGR